MEKEISKEQQDLLDAAGIVDGAQSGDDNEADRWFAALATRLRAYAGVVQFKDGDLVEHPVHGWRYKLSNVNHTAQGAHARYKVVGGQHDGWDSKFQGFFPYKDYRLVDA